ncbi:MAG: anti-sigma factor [Acidimicrobiia bacterium]|nr:anti-sigma factor [Acidimicrobiia bacterium]
MAELHDLVAAYALDALDDAERAVFETHLDGCAQCAVELEVLAPAATELADGASITPPPHMRASVLDAVASTPQAPPEPASVEVTRRHFAIPRWMTGLVAAAVVVVALGVSGVFNGGVTLEDVSAAQDSATVSLDGEVGSARFVYSDLLDTGYFITANLPEVSDAETYQLWLIAEGAAVPAGTFRPSDDGSVTFRVEGEIAAGKTLGMTIEPAGGSPAPTGEVLLAEVLG